MLMSPRPSYLRVFYTLGRNSLVRDMTFRTSGQVQTDKTAASMLEIKREIDEFVSSRPATATEVDRGKLNRVRSLPGSFATNSGFLGSIIAADEYGLPFDYAESSATRIEAVTLDGVHDAAKTIVGRPLRSRTT